MRFRAFAFVCLAASTASAWDTAFPAWCGTTVAAGTEHDVVIESATGSRKIFVGTTPVHLAFDPTCTHLAVVNDHVFDVNVTSGTATDLGVAAGKPEYVPISWAPSGATFAIAFFGGSTRGSDLLNVYGAGKVVRFALPAGEIDRVAMIRDDTALVAMKIGNIFGQVSVLRSTATASSPITPTTFTRVFLSPKGAIAESSAGISFIDPTGATRVVSSTAYLLRDIASDSSAALVDDRHVISTLSIASGTARAFKQDWVYSTNATGQKIVGRTNLGALVVDDGATVTTIYTPKGRQGAMKVSMSPDGTRVAFIQKTSSPHHAKALCGDWSWDEDHALVIAQVSPPAILATIPLARTLGCAVE